MSRQVLVSRIEQFSAAHRLYIRHYTEEENQKLFGKCSWVNGHGHNYKVEVRVKGRVDDETGMVMDIDDMKVQIGKVISELDHKFIDKDVPYFSDKPSTVENICIYFWEELKHTLPEGVTLNKVKIHETDKNVASYKG